MISRVDLVKELNTIDPNKSYYAITLLGTPGGNIQWSTLTHWVDWVDEKPGREIRKASLVDAKVMVKTWAELGEGHLIVNTPKGLLLYLRFGGNALVAKEIAEKYLSFMIHPSETAYDGQIGFKSADDLPPHAFKRATRPRQRMRVIKRDHYKCVICGRRPDNYTDIELHVHHIRPWDKGGLTEDENLITLCSTCHDGLKPHAEFSLFSLIGPDAFSANPEKRHREYEEGVRIYMETVKLL